MGSRVEELRDRVCVKAIKDVRRGFEVVEGGKAYRPRVKICLERARLLTESYKETGGGPTVLRRAKALSHILDNMTIYIQDRELLVGNVASDPYSMCTYPELYWRWLEKALNDGYKDMLDEEGKRELREINYYWRNRALQGKERDLLPESIKPYWYYKGPIYWAHHFDTAAPDFEKILRAGLKGLIEEAQEQLKKLDSDLTIHARDYLAQRNFLEATIIALEAGIRWAQRYAAEARELSLVEKDATRKKELEKIAEVCNWVPENPARTLHEAIQSSYFVHLVCNFIEQPVIGLGIRIDKTFYPFYKKDVEEGMINREHALELIKCLWVKLMEHGFLHPPMWTGVGGGGLAWQHVTIGGVDSEGRDVTNEMSYIVLDASRELQTIQPPIGLRYHDKTPRELILKAIDTLRSGVAQPAFFNDKVLVPMLMKQGIPLEDARDYAISECMGWIVCGKMIYRTTAGYIFLPKLLELALNKGIDKSSGDQLGCSTPDPTTFTSVEQVLEAYLQQFKFFSEKLLYIGNVVDALTEEYLPRPFLSTCIDGCIRKREDCTKWSPYNRRSAVCVGANNVADSLAAMKKLVFEEKRVTMAELLDALKHNWEGREDLHHMFLHEAPKFGNDDDYVDQIAVEVHHRTGRELGKFITYPGVPATWDGSVVVSSYTFAHDTGATPDGRMDGEAFHDGTISPAQGQDVRGPTAVLRSVSKIDPLLSCNHLLNQRWTPQFLEGKNRETFANYLKTWADLGIHHVQFNVINKERLLDAQKYPEKHTDLIIRVAGYAAYFIDLSRGLQNDIMRRTEQSLV